jgi:VWFA-related protein
VIPVPSKGVLLLVLSWGTAVALAQTAPVFQTGASNVLVDVVVIGPKDLPVDGLSRDSFTVLEDGHPQQVVSFESHSPATETGTGSATAQPPPSLPAGVYTNAQPVNDDSVDVLLIDSLNTPISSQLEAHKKLLAYLKEMPRTKPVAVFILNTKLRQVEDFTTDHAEMLKAVEESTRSAQSSPLLKTAEETDRDIKNEEDMMSLARAAGKPGMGQTMADQLHQFSAQQDSFQVDLRVRYTLGALNQLARYLSGMPGRKNLLWLSGSFPLAVQQNTYLKNPSDASRDFSSQVDHTSGLLAAARIAIYPIDARGLFPLALTAPSVSGGTMYRKESRVNEAQAEEKSENAEESLAAQEMAHLTGGEAIANTNDLKGALAQVDRDGAHYYTLAYHPSNEAQNGKTRHIEVRVQPDTYHLAYRRSYVAAPPLRPEDSFPTLLEHAVPSSTQIIFRLTPVSTGAQPASAPLAGSNPKVQRPVTRYKVSYDVDVSPLQLNPSADGALHDTVTLVVIAYDRSGTALNSTSNTLNLNVPAAAFSQFVKQGIQYPQQLDLPAEAAWLRAGILDQNSGKIGSIEVPLMIVH